jgi:hypothetical protein
MSEVNKLRAGQPAAEGFVQRLKTKQRSRWAVLEPMPSFGIQ